MSAAITVSQRKGSTIPGLHTHISLGQSLRKQLSQGVELLQSLQPPDDSSDTNDMPLLSLQRNDVSWLPLPTHPDHMVGSLEPRDISLLL